MDYTREPIIETIITPKEGCQLAIRSSKMAAQEEYFVDAVEIVSFGAALFFRSLERPRSFLVPVSDYEVLEVREARMVLKHVGAERSAIKIGGGKEASVRPERERDVSTVSAEEGAEEGEKQEAARGDKKKERRRPARRRKGRGERDEGIKEEGLVENQGEAGAVAEEEGAVLPPSLSAHEATDVSQEKKPGESALSSEMLASLLMPPSLLISETIARYREDGLFKDAFYSTEDEEKAAIVDSAVALVEAGLSPEETPGEANPMDLKDEDDLWNFVDDDDAGYPRGHR